MKLRTPRALPGWLRPDGYILSCLRRAYLGAFEAERVGAGTRILDLGAGEQPYRAALEHRGADYVPCDLGSGPHVEIVPGQPLAVERGAFDIGLSIQVLEHVWDLDEYLGHFRRHLKPDGRVLLSTHGVWIFHPHPEDFRRWTRMGLERELASRGFRVERTEALMGPLAWSTQIRSLGYCLVLYRLGVLGLPLAALLALLMNARMWIEDRLTPRSIRDDNACVYLVTAVPVATGTD